MPRFSGAFCGFRGIGRLGSVDTVNAFRATNRQARAFFSQGDLGQAQAMLSNAQSIYAVLSPEEQVAYGDELTYTQQILAGDQTAQDDYKASQNLLVVAQANKARQDAADAADWGGYKSGAQDGLNDGFKKLTGVFSWSGFIGNPVAVVLALGVTGYLISKARG